jgi:UDP-N-acetylmuramoyl-L-alanyl-D-glutamate--2,6-diaminopimelate ligase
VDCSERGVLSLPIADRPALPEPPFLVAGLGRAGTAAVGALTERVGSEAVRAWDADTADAMQRSAQALRTEGVAVHLGAWPLDGVLDQARTVVKSPGIRFDEPLIIDAHRAGLQVIDELELGWRLSRVPIVAVTGTDGKSTVSGLAAALLAAAGMRVELAGNTEFGPPLSAVDGSAIDCIACEVSSYQLEGCPELIPELAVLTGLTPEHLDRHGTVEGYAACKRRLFIRGEETVRRAVVNVDGQFGSELARELELRGSSVARVGCSASADYRIEDATSWTLRGARVELSTPAGPVGFDARLPGRYNARNLATGLAIADALGIERRVSLPALGSYEGPPGRFERIDAGQPFSVVVDFAHTPDGMTQLLETVRTAISPAARLILVFGIGSPRGPAMVELGQIARRSTDHLILTTSGFRGRPPMLTLEAILAGARNTAGGELEVVLDRRRAFGRAFEIAAAGDAIVIPGRGHYTHMSFDRRGVPVEFDDRVVAAELLRQQPALSTSSASASN